MAVENPHFSLPFRFDALRGGGAEIPVTEEDSYAEIGDGVELVLRTEQGQRRTLPEFGRPQSLAFMADRTLAQAIVQQTVDDADPRVRALVQRRTSTCPIRACCGCSRCTKSIPSGGHRMSALPVGFGTVYAGDPEEYPNPNAEMAIQETSIQPGRTSISDTRASRSDLQRAPAPARRDGCRMTRTSTCG